MRRAAAGKYQLIVDLDKAAPDSSPVNANHFGEQFHKRKEQAYGDMPHTAHTRQRFTRINVKYKNNTKPQQGSNNYKTKTNTQRRQPVLR